MAKIFDDVMEGLQEALAHTRGEKVPGLKVHVPKELDVAAIRKQTGFSQTAFAETIAVPVGTLRNWEQKRRRPEGPARVLLALLEQNPRVVVDTLVTVMPGKVVTGSVMRSAAKAASPSLKRGTVKSRSRAKT
jgi:putative transcriptional regulator